MPKIMSDTTVALVAPTACEHRGEIGDVRMMSVPDCPMCGKPGTPLFSDYFLDRLFGVPGSWRLVCCCNSACGLVWQDPRPVEEDLGKLYVRYFTHQESACRVSSGVFDRLRLAVLRQVGHRADSGMAWNVLGAFLAYIGPVREYMEGSVLWLRPSWRGRVLDVGCGNGEMLARMKQLNWEVAGVEPDFAGARVARDHFGIDVRGSLEEFPDSNFDVVTLSHVIEHLPDPVANLSQCFRVLKPKGRLVVATPNVRSLGTKWFKRSWVGWDPPRHLMLFTTECLRNCVAKAGFEVEEVRTPGRQAYFVWYSGKLIRRHTVVPHGSMRGMISPLIAAQGLLFHAVEYLLGSSGKGEELLLVAKKGPEPAM